MNRAVHISLFTTALVVTDPLGAQAAPTALELDTTHSRIGFTASTVLFDVSGKFTDYKVYVEGNPAVPTRAKVTAEINVDSIDTDNDKRDHHLKSADFFDAAKFPQMRYASTRISRTSDGLRLEGVLTIRGKSKSIGLPLSVATGKNGAGQKSTAYRGSLTIDRNDFGVGSDNIAAKISLADAVKIDILLVTLRSTAHTRN